LSSVGSFIGKIYKVVILIFRMKKILLIGVVMSLLLVGVVSGLLYTDEDVEEIDNYNIKDREGCMQILSDEIYNDCIRFYNKRGFKLGDPLIGYRK